MKQFATWDIETWKVTPDEDDVRDHRPLGISCAALMLSDDLEHPIVWRAADREAMTMMQAQDMVDALAYYVRQGYTITTWAGLGFDFDILAEESCMPTTCSYMAVNNHIDMMFHFFCQQGYPCSLGNACVGMGVPGKLKEVGGAKAPQMWQDGKCDKVVEYVIGDVTATMRVAQAVEKANGFLKWRSKRGGIKAVQLGQWKTANECLRIPLPDQSWMDNPMSRERFYAWTQQ